jgi:hypothetical protein
MARRDDREYWVYLREEDTTESADTGPLVQNGASTRPCRRWGRRQRARDPDLPLIDSGLESATFLGGGGHEYAIDLAMTRADPGT